MRFLPDTLARHPAVILTVALLLTIAAALPCVDWHTGTLRLQIDPSAEALLSASAPQRASYKKLQELFGDNDHVIVAVQLMPRVFTVANMERAAKITGALNELPGVSSVLSVANASNPSASDGGIDISSFGQMAATQPSSLPKLRREFNANPLYRGNLISHDGKVAAFVITLDDRYPKARLQGLAARLKQAVHRVDAQATVWVTGTAIVRAATTKAITQTLWFTIPAVFGLVLLLLLIAFRSPVAAVSALLTVGMALIWTLATIQLAGLTLNLVTTIVPPLVVTIGLSYTIHLLAAYFLGGKLAPDLEGASLRAWVMRRIGPGLALSAMTTATGFMALSFNHLPAVREFAWLASLGTVYLALATWLILPILLVATGCRRRKTTVGERLFSKLADQLASFNQRHRTAIVLVALLVIPLAIWSATHIRTGTNFIASFDRNAPVRHDFEAINRAFNGANVISILIQTHLDNALTRPELIKPLEGLEAWLRGQPEVGSVSSYIDYLKLINQSLRGGRQAAYAIPDSQPAIAQELMFAGGNTLNHLVDARYRNALITVRINVDGSLAIGQFLNRLNRRLKQLPEPLSATATGSTVLATSAVNAIPEGHWESVLIATVVIWLLLSAMFTSWRAGLLATVPNLVPIAIYFGTLGALGIHLNPTTSMIACIVLGIAVNDTIHYLARFNIDARRQGGEANAVKSAMESILWPITLATIALCLGFLMFTGSALQSQAQFGALAAFTLAVAWVSDMTLTPALSSRMRIVTLWDLLRLDLGANPQQTIPLLADLSTRQARLFALLSHLETHPPGERLIHEGDYARDIYVIVDGSAQAWVERGKDKKILSTMRRGSTIGEAGYFGQRRTANVSTVTEVRLLRFDSHDLERLRRRYPFIAATVFRNLNRIQAERIARMTAMVE